MRYHRNAISVPTWPHVGAIMVPCWLKKPSWQVLGRFGRLLGGLASKQGVWGGAAPQHCKRIDLKGVLRPFEASSRHLGGASGLMFPALEVLGEPSDPLRGIQAEIQGLQIQTLRGIQQKAGACTQAEASAARVNAAKRERAAPIARLAVTCLAAAARLAC